MANRADNAGGVSPEVLSRISHEFRTPLNIIIGFSELMLEEVPGRINESQKNCLKDILDSGRKLSDMVDDLVGRPRDGASPVK